MKIVPVGATPPAPATGQGMDAAMQRAKAAFQKSAASQQAPAPQQQAENPIVQNQNNISPEEASVVMRQEQQQEEEEQQEVAEMDGKPHEERQVEEPAKPVDTPESRRFAQLARQEKAIRQKAQEIRAQEQALQQRQAELESREQGYRQQPPPDQTKYVSRDMFKNDPISALSELGLSYEEITNAYINHTPQDPRVQATISKLEAKLAALEAANETAQKQSVEAQTQQYQAAIKQLKTDTKALVDSDPNFETIKATRSHDDVVDLIEQTYKKDGILLSVEEAAQQVEDYLLEEAMRLTNIKKIKAKLAQNSAPKAQTQTAKTSAATANEPKQTQMKTLTNNTASTRQLSSKERAILAFKGQLK